MGIHLVVINSKITSSEAKFKTFTENTVDCTVKAALSIGKCAFKVTRFDYKYRVRQKKQSPSKNSISPELYSRFFHQIYNVYRGGFQPHIQQILLQYSVGLRNYNYLNLKVHFSK